MNKIYLVFSLILLFTLSFCSYPEKIKDGRTAFERKQFAKAIPMLEADFKKAKTSVEKGKIAFQLGESHARINDREGAEKWYGTAYDNQYGSDALKGYAYALKQGEKYKEAVQAFTDLGIEIGTPYEYRKEIESCKKAAVWKKKKDKNRFKVEEVKLNSPGFDYAPVIYEKDQLIFTSDRSKSEGDEKYEWTGRAYSDLFLKNETGSIDAFSSTLNTDFNEGTITFNSDYSIAIFSRCGTTQEGKDDYCKLYMSQRVDDDWAEGVVLNFIQENINYAHPSLSRDGNTLYFSSNDSETSWGGYDLFKVEREGSEWGEPRNLGRSINTPMDEMFPFIEEDTLYFASEGLEGMGGLDIFKSVGKKGRWSRPKNLKAPINSGADDFGLVVHRKAAPEDKIEIEGYFASAREGGKGLDDIYRFYRKAAKPKPKLPKTDTIPTKPKKDPPKIVYKLILEGIVLEKIYSIPDNPNSKVMGRKPLPGSEVDINFNGQKKTITVNPDGTFSFEMEEEMDYYFFGKKEGYLNNTARFSTRNIGRDPEEPIQTFQVEIVLDKIFKNKEITLDNIYYDYDKWDIRPDAQPTLNQLANILQQNPQIKKIRLASHTDCRGGDNYNQQLSQKRAQSAVDYLITRGVSGERLSATGFGEKAPAVSCSCNRCTEEEHQINRRTTFTIVE